MIANLILLSLACFNGWLAYRGMQREKALRKRYNRLYVMHMNEMINKPNPLLDMIPKQSGFSGANIEIPKPIAGDGSEC